MSQFDLFAILPIRLESLRIPKKMLAVLGTSKKTKITLCELAVDSALLAFKDQKRVLVAAAVDNEKTYQLLKARFPTLEVILTSPEIPTGTDRVFAASRSLEKRFGRPKGILNIQGDMPFMGSEGLKLIGEYFLSSNEKNLKQYPMATLSQDWPLKEKLDSNSAVKVISNFEGGAIYFSRFAIPHSKEKSPKSPLSKLHLGVYGYTPETLLKFCNTPPSELEKAESLEQLRALYLGIAILVIPTQVEPGRSYRGIDTPKDLLWAKTFFKKSGLPANSYLK